MCGDVGLLCQTFGADFARKWINDKRVQNCMIIFVRIVSCLIVVRRCALQSVSFASNLHVMKCFHAITF